jgi:hypothetical protein
MRIETAATVHGDSFSVSICNCVIEDPFLTPLIETTGSRCQFVSAASLFNKQSENQKQFSIRSSFYQKQ